MSISCIHRWFTKHIHFSILLIFITHSYFTYDYCHTHIIYIMLIYFSSPMTHGHVYSSCTCKCNINNNHVHPIPFTYWYMLHNQNHNHILMHLSPRYISMSLRVIHAIYNSITCITLGDTLYISINRKQHKHIKIHDYHI